MKSLLSFNIISCLTLFYNNILDLFFPNCCLNCDQITDHILCSCCSKLINPMLWESNSFDDLVTVYSIFEYKGIIKKIIKEAKYRKQDSGIFYLISQFISQVKQPQTDLVIPIPLYKTKLFERGFNQAQIIAKSICDKYSLWQCDDSLLRIRNTTALYGLSREQRESELESSFALLDVDQIRGKSVLLVDDICTTGTTLVLCAKLLKEAGASSVSAFVLARSVKSSRY